jgi:aspartyl-tRNA synthetase
MNTEIKNLRLCQFTDEAVRSILNDSKTVTVCGFCHNIRVNKNMIFIVLRQEINTIQLIVFRQNNPLQFEQIKDLYNEATIDVVGEIVPATVKTCTVKNYEIKINSVKIINSSVEMPFNLDNANETFQSDSIVQDQEDLDVDQSVRSKVGRQMRLDNRWLDLRIPINQNIFRLRSAFEDSVRRALFNNDFMGITTPKIIPAVSEGSAGVFEVNYFGKTVYLAQSPQLYKQMMINGGFNRVFEIGPVFRAENANTYRHLCEFTGLDMEFCINPEQSHIDIINIIWQILHEAYCDFTFRNLNMIKYVIEQTKSTQLLFPEEPVLIDFKDGCSMLNDIGVVQDPLNDIGSVNEKILGDIVKQKYNTDVYVLVGFPNNARPFYTMHEDENYSRSFDFMMRGNEISSGAQRVHDPSILKQAVLNKGIKLDGTSGLEDYIKSFESGSMPHGGAGFGLERLIMLILGLSNVRTTTLFPRDPKRTTP